MAKYPGVGTALQLDIAATYTTIAGVRELTVDPGEVKTYDETDLASADEEIGVTGLVGGGSCTFSMFVDPVAATFQALTDLITTPAIKGWKVIWPDSGSTEWGFDGALTKLPVKANLTDGLMADGEIALDGIPTLPT